MLAVVYGGAGGQWLGGAVMSWCDVHASGLADVNVVQRSTSASRVGWSWVHVARQQRITGRWSGVLTGCWFMLDGVCEGVLVLGVVVVIRVCSVGDYRVGWW